MKPIYWIFIVMLISSCTISNFEEVQNNKVTDFDSCVAAGNPVMESYPRQCRCGDQTFTENIKESIEPSERFCGTSSEDPCETNEDCITGGCSGSICQSKNTEPTFTTCEYRDCYNAEAYKMECKCAENKCKWN